MSLWSRLVGGNAASPPLDYPLDLKTAMLVPMVIMMWADAEDDETETSSIHAVYSLSPLFKTAADAKTRREEIDRWIKEAYHYVRERCRDERLACANAAKVMGPDLLKTAYTFATLVSYADGSVRDEEKKKAAQLVKWLGLRPKDARQIDAYYQALWKTGNPDNPAATPVTSKPRR